METTALPVRTTCLTTLLEPRKFFDFSRSVSPPAMTTVSSPVSWLCSTMKPLDACISSMTRSMSLCSTSFGLREELRSRASSKRTL